jgi:mono/diheme cytochrome c family protein
MEAVYAIGSCCLLWGCARRLYRSGTAQDVANGERIAKTWCAGCHRVSTDEPIGKVNDAAPSFMSVAQTNNITERSLDSWLSKPHAGMPDFFLTHAEIADVSAYILSFRK